MKKSLIHWFRFLIALLLISWFLAAASCARKPIESSIKIDSTLVEKSNVSFKKFLDRSLAINDTFKFGIPKITTGATKLQDCDSLCNLKVKEALKGISSSKSSGNSNYNFYYDKYTDQLTLAVHQGETIKEKTDSIAVLQKLLQVKSEKTIKIPVEKPFSKEQKFNLWIGRILWVLLIAFFGWKILTKIKTIKPI
jgi:hypothetical protein